MAEIIPPPRHAIVMVGSLLGIIRSESSATAVDAIKAAHEADAAGLVLGLAAFYFDAVDLLAEGTSTSAGNVHWQIAERLKGRASDAPGSDGSGSGQSADVGPDGGGS